MVNFYFLFFNFLTVGELVYQSKKPLKTVISPKSEKALRTMVLKLSLPS